MSGTQRTFYLGLRIGSQALLSAQFLDWKKLQIKVVLLGEGKTDTVSAKVKQVLMQAWNFRCEAKCLGREEKSQEFDKTHTPFCR